ncbi:MAG: J domain-containing protein, partial [Proteobacteria bacterium]|nr:J domain-containing protein [Pseudomonadota bacterium]
GGLASTIGAAASDLIGNLFRQRAGKQKGGDVRYTLEVTFEEAAFGCEKKITLADGRELTIVIGAGTKDGAVKTLRGEGEPGAKGAKGSSPAGDLHVMIRVAEHAFRREGFDVHAHMEITFSQAALGAILEVPTIDGIVKMRIPEGTQPGRVFRIRGRGIPQAAGKTSPRGDHLLEVQVVVPTELTARQRELIEELGRTTNEDHAPPGGRKRLIDRVRSLLDE